MNLDLGLQRGFRLGDIAINPRQHEVQREGHHHVLSDRAIALLMVLAESPGEVIPMAHLRDRLDTADYADMVNSLRELQEALGDSPQYPHLVRQVGQEGFQLLVNIAIDVPPIPTTAQIITGGGNPDA